MKFKIILSNLIIFSAINIRKRSLIMARLTGGTIFLGNVSKHMRYIAGGASTPYKKESEKQCIKTNPEVRVIKKAQFQKTSSHICNLTIEPLIENKKISLILKGTDLENYDILYSSSNRIDEAIQYTAPININLNTPSMVFIWLVKNGFAIKTYVMDIIRKKGIQASIKPIEGKLPLGDHFNIFETSNYDDENMIVTFSLQDLGKSLDNMDYVSKESQFLFRKDLMDSFYEERFVSLDSEYEEFIDTLNPVEIMELIHGFNKIGFQSKTKEKLIAPTKWLWNYYEPDGSALGRLGFWNEIIDINISEVYIQSNHIKDMTEFPADDIYKWDTYDFKFQALQKITGNTILLPAQINNNNICTIFDSSKQILKTSNEQMYNCIKYLTAIGMERMDVESVHMATAKNCAYIMTLLIEENDMDWHDVLYVVSKYNNFVKKPSKDLLSKII